MKFSTKALFALVASCAIALSMGKFVLGSKGTGLVFLGWGTAIVLSSVLPRVLPDIPAFCLSVGLGALVVLTVGRQLIPVGSWRAPHPFQFSVVGVAVGALAWGAVVAVRRWK